MDGARFDYLARALAGRRSRRRVLSGLLGLGASAAGLQTIDAACPSDQVRRRGTGCVCKTSGRSPGADGFCPCASRLTRCGDACVDLDREVNHCGACDAACVAGPGVAELACRRGACRVAACVVGLADCDGDLACETELGTDADCGRCGDACTGSGKSCGGGGTPGVCEPPCVPLTEAEACGAQCGGTAGRGCGLLAACGFGECDGDDYCVQRTEDDAYFCASNGFCFFPTTRSCSLGCVGRPCDESTGYCVRCLLDADCDTGDVCVEGLDDCPKACVSYA